MTKLVRTATDSIRTKLLSRADNYVIKIKEVGEGEINMMLF